MVQLELDISRNPTTLFKYSPLDVTAHSELAAEDCASQATVTCILFFPFRRLYTAPRKDESVELITQDTGIAAYFGC